MAATYKVLGQSAPLATTATTLYTCPGQTVISTLFVCNRGNSITTFRISVDVDGAGDDNKDYLYYDVEIAANDTLATTTGITLNKDDLIRVYAGNANLSFSAFGAEIA